MKARRPCPAQSLEFARFAPPARGVLIVFTDESLRLGEATRRYSGRPRAPGARSRPAERFTGKSGSVLDLIAPAGLKASRLVFIGIGKKELKSLDFAKLGGIAMGKIGGRPGGHHAGDLPAGPMKPERWPSSAMGVRLRAYTFDRYKTKRKEGDEPPVKAKITIGVADVAAARRAWHAKDAIAEGVVIARDLVNEPANILYPEEFARRTRALKKLGVDGRGARRQGDAALRDERAVGGGAGLGAGKPPRRDALERRQARRSRRSPSSARA